LRRFKEEFELLNRNYEI
jgi:hypothetical protein